MHAILFLSWLAFAAYALYQAYFDDSWETAMRFSTYTWIFHLSFYLPLIAWILFFAPFILLSGLLWWWVYIPREVTFNQEHMIFEDRQFDITRITRIDYGSSDELTGQVEILGQYKINPQLIRVWFDDKIPLPVSKNQWVLENNHRIRATLAEALDQVRNAGVETVREKKFGRAGDSGIPDID